MENTNKNIDIIKKICKCEDIKELGSGGNGTAFSAVKSNETLVYKIEKMDKYNENNELTSEYYRQLKFNQDIAIHYSDKFLILKDHGIITDCSYKHPTYDRNMIKYEQMINLKEKPNERLRRYYRKNSQSNCYWLAYTPYLDGSYGKIQDVIYSDSKLFLNFMYQMIQIINIMRKKGYAQNDPNPDNIMYKKINDNEYQWYIIDYGNMYNKYFPLSELDIDIRGRNLYGLDLVMFVNRCRSPNLNKFIENYNLELNNALFEENIKSEPIYLKIKKILPLFKRKAHADITTTICKILEPHIFFKCHGVAKEIYEKYVNNQLFPDILIYCLKHYNDETYDHILTMIKQKLEQKGGQYDINILSPEKHMEFIGESVNLTDKYMKKYFKYKSKYMTLKTKYI